MFNTDTCFSCEDAPLVKGANMCYNGGISEYFETCWRLIGKKWEVFLNPPLMKIGMAGGVSGDDNKTGRSAVQPVEKC